MFTAKKITDSLYMIIETEPGEPVIFCMYLVVGEKRAVLIDSGLKSSDDLSNVIRSITSLPAELYLTHGHHDHIGNIDSFDNIHIGYEDSFMLGEGTSFISIVDGEMIDLGGIVLKAYALSGHTPGAFCFLNSNEGYAITGDIINHETWLCWNYCDTPSVYAKKVRTFYDMAASLGITSVFEGHCDTPLDVGICLDMITSLSGITKDTALTDCFHHSEKGSIKNIHTFGASTIIYDKERILKMSKGFTVTPDNIPNSGIMFVDHESNYRSGHMGHALVEYAKDSILAFYSNSSAAIENGHTGYGWMEYKRTTDGGKTWSEANILDYSYRCFIDGVCNISCEKAVCTDKGTIVLFCLRNKSIMRWEPYLEPAVLRSFDGGETWTKAKLMTHFRGRIMDAFCRNGKIYALEFCNDAEIKWTGNLPEHIYRLFVSEDDGETFNELSILPFDTFGRHYGTMEFLPNDDLIVYIYNENEENDTDYCISHDIGKTWDKPSKTYFAKRLRNPQLCTLGGIYFIHGRSGKGSKEQSAEFVLYTSTDGIHWDDGNYLRVTVPKGIGGLGYYSNNIVTGRFGGKKRILIQASDPYNGGRVNIKHWWIDIDE